MAQDLRGVLTALTTPFDEDQKIDRPTLRRVIDRSIQGGVHGVVAGGSTGEFAALSGEERRLVIDTVIEHTAGRVPVIAQTGATTTVEAIRLSRAAQQSGADVLMLVTPYYEPMSREETLAYIKDVAATVDVPIMLYNIPAATGVNLDPATVGSLAREIEHVLYVKDSSANWEQALQLIHHHGHEIGTFIGWDSYVFSALIEGAAGVMAGAANVVPRGLVAVQQSIENGELNAALQQWRALYPVIDALLSVPFIPAVKAGMAMQGLDVGVPRAPMAALPAAAAARLDRALSSLT